MKIPDFTNIMTYDFATGVTSEQAIIPIFMDQGSSREAVAISHETFMAQGIPVSSCGLGVAFYGRAWSGVSGENNGLGQEGVPGAGGFDTSYTNLSANLINKNGFTRYWDEDAKAPYLYNGDIFISYDDEESIGYKVDYIKKTGLGGVMFWEYSSDKTGSLLQKLYEGLGS